MINKNSPALSIILSILTILSSFYAYADNVDDRYMYVGTEIGISDPVVKSFKFGDDNEKTDVELGRSKMLGGRLGYSFYPSMMIELSVTHQPKYDVKYTLPAAPLLMFPKTKGKTRNISDVYTINLLYELEKINLGLKPYFIFGAGIARMNIKPTSSKHPVLGIDVFKIRKSKMNCLAWQAGAGMILDITDNLSLDLSAKLQAVHDVKIKYAKLNPITGEFVAQKPVKQSVGLGEYVLGFTYRFPLSKN